MKGNIAGKDGVKGIILAEDADEGFQYALNMAQNIECKKYSLSIKIH
ncbi:MAG: hypothetical protein QXX77_01255 [Candidatus Methanosuratincola sp.]